ncbi:MULTISPECIES: CDP-alcohol phosphatidyltransferase family protein [Thalassospira]|jgi:phosphatidylglycerophosphate synthase|uniref:CDP-alcohol phosphatidyltransferase n=1 Tax=Thalassospira xiamenensis TaxID=220697 RepID=A0ABR5XW69_9PROT|nr:MULTISPECIES: CDP-alcohol phosphatidyltransferase family protein [Thalassospira]MBL4840643.1 CDP-alcohol phosphatidyltransferase family protein [Thalassospira sp.]MBR9780292.1 CDP-alcohol phosphatidyltransferase family protein [Rhodospirillales bacterium]KZC96631.1 CDP-alcohol phosphatidyltransferase [Thalassospira xiamenensis]KZD10547.1 CDP-alcohol phosphatidyltransferase [Thalassospira xiamenensis]MBR9815489.1 CDP-alcohol phosphatidyltransferase family protein [Rhodospirillales bacterium]|tara:strand:+ start:3731 stop:4366 length:636 start_codon:yes stop_codon:yes gene_type:complete
MFDARLRPLIDKPLNAVARRLSGSGITPNMVTGLGFVFGLLAAAALAFRLDHIALGLILLSRIMDGLDGAVARHTQPRSRHAGSKSQESDLGGYYDIVADFLFYSGIILAFAIGRPEHALMAAFLIFCFVGTGSSFLAYAIIAAKTGRNHEKQGKKSFYYLTGITEGSETIFVLVLICVFPQWFNHIAAIFGALCILTTIGRVMQARRDFG